MMDDRGSTGAVLTIIYCREPKPSINITTEQHDERVLHSYISCNNTIAVQCYRRK